MKKIIMSSFIILSFCTVEKTHGETMHPKKVEPTHQESWAYKNRYTLATGLTIL